MGAVVEEVFDGDEGGGYEEDAIIIRFCQSSCFWGERFGGRCCIGLRWGMGKGKMSGGGGERADLQYHNPHTNNSLTQMTFRRSTAPLENIAALMPRSSDSMLNTLRRPRRNGDERREPKNRKQNIDGGVSVGIRETFDAVELRDGSLVDEEWDAEPALCLLL